MDLSARFILPDDETRGLLIGRAWLPAGPAQTASGPSPVVLYGDAVHDLSGMAATTSALFDLNDPAKQIRAALEAGGLPVVGDLNVMLAESAWNKRDAGKAHFLAPCDLQALRASGVTFVDSMVERVIEEQAKGDPAQAEAIRDSLTAEVGAKLADLKPGSPEAARLKESLIERGLWSQYLEVGIGPDAEIFTKSQPMSAVGCGAEIGILASSVWNNPEPEVALVVNSRGAIVGATLGNDVNLRDVEGRSALLLGRAKDNNASCALGPFIRLLDESFDMERLRNTVIEVEIAGDDGFRIADTYPLSAISRSLEDLVGQAHNAEHQYPDGLMLFLGTMFAPIQDREVPGEGFTHKLGDTVTIRSKELGALINRVNHCDKIAPWTFGSTALMKNLAQRGLL
ncbi:fumarylacetoacetate hydrolase family protein [Pelagibius litoralis]|uniref:Fumarylacetoacetate hydrolase family protein n=1 Tax=Pelagibius litoralis TaxID=374515 RepID=A0A967F0T0_9PROT|nr:fumarylacetoacetate hydrolase family protein [Pelagibius litoralis]NIA70924.1 fumarylacetoacetate hydrolase family protein [Pelagibius litoralis]